MANTFNKWVFVDELQKNIIEEINKGNIYTTDGYWDYIFTEIDNACIYYSDCFDICKDLNATHFDDYDYECTTITELAYASLKAFVDEKLDTNQLEELLNTINQ